MDLIGHRLVPFGSSSPLAGPVIAHRPCKVLGLGPRHDGEAHHCSHRFATPSAVDSRYANFSPVTDAIGRIRRCQRSTCVTAVLPVPIRGTKSISEGFPPQTVGMIAQTAAVRQLPRPRELAHDVGHSVPKHKFRTAFANTARNRPITEMPLNCYAKLRTDIIPSGWGLNTRLNNCEHLVVADPVFRIATLCPRLKAVCLIEVL